MLGKWRHKQRSRMHHIGFAESYKTPLHSQNPILAFVSLLFVANSVCVPLVELSQHCKGAKLRVASAIVTRLRSPPLTPRTKSLPTRVSAVWLIPNMAMITWRCVSRFMWGFGNLDSYVSQVCCVTLSRDSSWDVSRGASERCKV